MFFEILKECFLRMDHVLPSLPAGHVNALYILAGLMAAALLLIVFLSVRRSVRFLPAVVSLITASAVLAVCIFYPDLDLLYAHPAGNPAEKTDAFLAAVNEGRIGDAYGILSGNRAAEFSGAEGAGAVFGDDTAAMYYSFLTKSFRCEYTGEMNTVDLKAYVPVRIWYADLSDASARIDEEFDTQLDRIVQNNARKDVYGDDDSYEGWVIEQAYNDAAAEILSGEPAECFRDLVISLSFTEGSWMIDTSDELLDILGGGVCAGPSSEKNLSDKIALYANNSKSNILADLVYIPKLYSIPEDALCGYEPCEDKYHELEDPYLIADAIAGSEHLIKGADLVFDPDVTFATGQRIYYYADDSIFAIVWKEYCNNCYCNFAEVFISDPSQLKRKIAGDAYGYGTQLYASSMAAQANAVVAMNGDFYKFRPLGICVYDRTVYRCEGASLDTCFFDTQGNMIFSYAGELTDKDEAQRFVDENDILFSLSFGPVLIDNGVPKENLNYRIGETMQRYSRSAIGQLGENHYLLMTIGHVYPYKECCTLKGAQDIMLLKGCVNAYTLDGGQTAELIWRDRPYSYVDWGVERTISDIIYFATAVPEDEQ
jgi:uncharacterized protein YigE (DUF2233 family)